MTNYAVPTECPYCGNFDHCDPTCGCPGCQGADTLANWCALAPVMVELTNREISWSWNLEGFVDDIVTTGSSDRETFEVHLSNDGQFVVDHWWMVRLQTREHPAEWDTIASAKLGTATAVADWIQANTREF